MTLMSDFWLHPPSSVLELTEHTSHESFITVVTKNCVTSARSCKDQLERPRSTDRPHSLASTGHRIAFQVLSLVPLRCIDSHLPTPRIPIHNIQMSTPQMQRRVRFARDPVECYHRLLHTAELNILNRYEDHIWERPGCLRTLKRSGNLSQICPHCRYLLTEIWMTIEVFRARPIERRRRANAPPTFIHIPERFTATRMALDSEQWRGSSSHNDLNENWLLERVARQGDRRAIGIEIYREVRTVYRERSRVYNSEVPFRSDREHDRISGFHRGTRSSRNGG